MACSVFISRIQSASPLVPTLSFRATTAVDSTASFRQVASLFTVSLSHRVWVLLCIAASLHRVWVLLCCALKSNLTPKVVFGNMAADDTAGSFVTSNVTETNETGWTDVALVLITSHKLNNHNAVTTMVPIGWTDAAPVLL
ncbi:uncharacterized protein G2W53_040662 [Senna tora]|uniref:Uncharacterized protein n=1 Tax=Senna tora TaxID=362788 RepID=A0A834SEG3_9FABA|nr:uncharacterized protein G2W53_040662 [Senna tora]